MFCAVYNDELYNIHEGPFSGDVVAKVQPFDKIRIFRSKTEFDNAVMVALRRRDEWEELNLSLPPSFAIVSELELIDFAEVEELIEDMCLEVVYDGLD